MDSTRQVAAEAAMRALIEQQGQAAAAAQQPGQYWDPQRGNWVFPPASAVVGGPTMTDTGATGGHAVPMASAPMGQQVTHPPPPLILGHGHGTSWQPQAIHLCRWSLRRTVMGTLNGGKQFTKDHCNKKDSEEDDMSQKELLLWA